MQHVEPAGSLGVSFGQKHTTANLLCTKVTPVCVLHAACRAQVEELLQTKPAPASMDDSSSVVSVGGSSKLDMFTRKFKNTVVELINADLSQPISSQSHGHSPLQLTPRQQQPEQQPSRSSTPVPPGQPQQQQQHSPAAQPSTQQQGTAVSCSSSSSPAAQVSREGAQGGGPSSSLQPGKGWCFQRNSHSMSSEAGCLTLLAELDNVVGTTRACLMLGPLYTLLLLCVLSVRLQGCMLPSSGSVCRPLTPWPCWQTPSRQPSQACWAC